MIDIENKVYSLVRAALKSVGVDSGSVYTDNPAKFPYVFFELTNSTIYDRGIDSGKLENFANQTFQISIYSQGSTKKTEAKSLANLIDGVLSELGLKRIFYSPIPNFEDNSIFRIVTRYQGIIGDNNKIYN